MEKFFLRLLNVKSTKLRTLTPVKQAILRTGVWGMGYCIINYFLRQRKLLLCSFIFSFLKEKLRFRVKPLLCVVFGYSLIEYVIFKFIFVSHNNGKGNIVKKLICWWETVYRKFSKTCSTSSFFEPNIRQYGGLRLKHLRGNPYPTEIQ